jgi:hypothetical protein
MDVLRPRPQVTTLPLFRRWLLCVLRCIPALLAFLLVLGPGFGTARAEEPMEYQIKGVYLFKFAAYVDWPPVAFPQPGMPFVIGILGQDPFGSNLDLAVKSHTIQGRPILIRRFKRVEDVRDVQILYLGPGETEHWDHVLASLRDRSVLTVSDGASQAGAIINFVIQGNKVRFEINADAADRVDMKLSSKLLSLASAVKRSSSKREG